MMTYCNHCGHPIPNEVSPPESPLVTNATKGRRLIPVTQWADHHPWPPIGGLRHLVFHADSNGFGYCLVRIGRRVLIDEEKFFTWAENAKPKR